MDSEKTLLPALITDIVICVISCFFLYYGIHTEQTVLAIIGGALLIISFLRLILFFRAYKKHGE